MSAEAATYARELQWILAQVCACLKDVTPAQLNWRPDTGGANSANSAYAIAYHVGEVTRVYALGFGGGRRVTRDRSTEFSGTGDDAGALIARLEALGAELATALATLSPGDLERRQRPPRELWGGGEIHEISARDALVESIRHAGVHLGELRLTRDLALRHA